MIRYYIIIVVGLLFSSCATIINQRTVKINVRSNTDSVKIYVNNDTTRWYNTPAWIDIERSRNDLWITAKKDSIQKRIQVNSKLSDAFWMGNLFYGGGLVGYAIDLTNPKRYTYPQYVNLDFKNGITYPTKKYKTGPPPVKNLLSFKIAIPESNHFYLNKGNGYGNSFGFLGISAGVEYYLTDKYAISSDVGVLINFLVPFPAPVHYGGTYQRSSAFYGNVQIGSDFNRLHYGLGLQYNKSIYNKFTYNDLDTIPSSPKPYYNDTLSLHKIQNNVGLIFSSYYRISKGFNIGLSYYPSYLSWHNKKLEGHYSHLIFFDLLFKIQVYRPKK